MTDTKGNSSILSFPNRGHWGDSRWRGNCSGFVYQSLFEQLQPKVFTDPMMGSGTSIEVAKEMQIEAYGFDLFNGFNAITDSILEAVGKESDLVLSHPPYGGQVTYSGKDGMWGTEPHPADLSRCADDLEFHEKMNQVMLNQRRATKANGYYGCIIGDWRRNGVYSSYQAEIIARLPSSELAGVIIKAQHNCVSDSRRYGRMTLPRIGHEYILLFRKIARSPLVLLSEMSRESASRLNGTWKAIVSLVLQSLGGRATLDTLYSAIEKGAPEKLQSNPNWKAKIRQTLNTNETLFTSDQRGHWGIA